MPRNNYEVFCIQILHRGPASFEHTQSSPYHNSTGNKSRHDISSLAEHSLLNPLTFTETSTTTEHPITTHPEPEPSTPTSSTSKRHIRKIHQLDLNHLKKRRVFYSQSNRKIQHDTNDIDDRSDECSDNSDTSFSPLAFKSFGLGGGIGSCFVIGWGAWRHGKGLFLMLSRGDWSGLLIVLGATILTRSSGGHGGCLCVRR